MDISIHQSQFGRIVYICTENAPRLEVPIDNDAIPTAQALRHEVVCHPELADTLLKAADIYEFGAMPH